MTKSKKIKINHDMYDPTYMIAQDNSMDVTDDQIYATTGVRTFSDMNQSDEISEYYNTKKKQKIGTSISADIDNIIKIMSNISDNDMKFMGFNCEKSLPSNFICDKMNIHEYNQRKKYVSKNI